MRSRLAVCPQTRGVVFLKLSVLRLENGKGKANLSRVLPGSQVCVWGAYRWKRGIAKQVEVALVPMPVLDKQNVKMRAGVDVVKMTKSTMDLSLSGTWSIVVPPARCSLLAAPSMLPLKWPRPRP